METFLARTVIPKLAVTLDMLDINPRNQNIGMNVHSYVHTYVYMCMIVLNCKNCFEN